MAVHIKPPAHFLTIMSPSLLLFHVSFYLPAAAFYLYLTGLSLAVFITLSVGHYFINLYRQTITK